MSDQLPSNLDAALELAGRGWPVMPTCWPVWPTPGSEPECGCGGGHTGRDIGKAPIGRLVPNGVLDATTDPAIIARWWRQCPDANVSVDLKRAGLVMVDPDSDMALADAYKRGISFTILRHSRNKAFLFRAPPDCPALRLTQLPPSGKLDVLSDGYMVAHGTHANGDPVYLDETHPIANAEAWAVKLLAAKATEKATREHHRAERAAGGFDAGDEPPVRLHDRGLKRWRGELREPDRSKSLFMLGLDLAECGATKPTIMTALAERDAALGWNKFSDRADADDRYGEIADAATDREDKRRAESKPVAVAGDAPCFGCRQRDATIIERDSVIAVQADVIAGERSERERLGRLVNAQAALFRNPDLSATDKLVVAAAADIAYHHKEKDSQHAERQVVNLSAIRRRTGVSEQTASKSLERATVLDKKLIYDVSEDGARIRKVTILANLPSVADAILAVSNHHAEAPRNHGGRPDRRGCRNGCEAKLSVQTVTSIYCTGCGELADEIRCKPRLIDPPRKSQDGIYDSAPCPPPVSNGSLIDDSAIYGQDGPAEVSKSQDGTYSPDTIEDLIYRHRQRRNDPRPPGPEHPMYAHLDHGARQGWDRALAEWEERQREAAEASA